MNSGGAARVQAPGASNNFMAQLRGELMSAGKDPSLASDPRAAAQALEKPPGFFQQARGWINENIPQSTQNQIGNQLFNQEERQHELALSRRYGAVPSVSGQLGQVNGLMNFYPQQQGRPRYQPFGR